MVGVMMVFMHWMQAQWPHGIIAVSRGLVQQTGQFVDDAAAVVDTLVRFTMSFKVFSFRFYGD